MAPLMAIREPLAIARAAGGPGSPGGPAIREPLARTVTKPVVEPTALALREPSTSEAQRLQAAPNETTRLRMELARAKADLVESEHQAQELREQSRKDLQDMLWQLKDSEQRLLALAKQANLREQHDRRSGESWALTAVEDLQHLLSFLHPERLQEDACAFSRGEATEALPVPSSCSETVTTEDRGYVQQSLKWSSAVVSEARQMYFSLFLKLRNAGCSMLLRLLSRLCARQCLQAFNLFRGPSETATPERSKVSGEGTMTTQTPMPMEDSWQSWRSWLRSAPNSAQKPAESNAPDGPLQRVLAKAAHGVADNQLCKVLMHWHGYCFRRRRALHCLVNRLQHCEDRIRRRALQTFRLWASQRRWETHAAEASKDLEAQQRRVTRSRRYWSAHLLMRVERGNLTKIFRSWARHCQQMQDLSLKSQIQALARHRSAHPQTMAASESKVLALVLARSKAAEGQLICRFFSAWSQWRLRSKLRSEKKTNSLKLEAKSNRWWLPVTFQAWKLQLGTLRWLQRCEDRWKGQKTQSRLRRSWTSWRSLTLSSEVKQRRVLEKQEIKQAAKSLISAWFSWTRFQRQTTRWHASFVRLLRAARSNRKVILLQAALASWQQFTLRTSFGIKKSQLKGQLYRMERRQHLRRCFHAWTLQKHSQLQRSRSATGAYGLQLAQRQFLRCLLRQWRRCAKRARLSATGGRMGWREQMIMQKIFLQLHFAAVRGRTMRTMGAKMLWMAIGKQQQRRFSDLLRRWKEQGSRGQHRRQSECLADKNSKEVLGLYLYAWYFQSHSLQRRKRLRRLPFHEPTEADLHRLRQSFSLWRCRCRLLRLHQWSGTGAGGARREGDRRLMLRAWQKLVQEKQRARALVLWTCFKEWTAQVEQDQQMRHMRSLAATACAKVRQQALLLAVMAFWSQLACQGQQTAVNMALIASRHQWLVAAVAAGNRASLCGAWKSWVHGIQRAHQALHLKRFLLRRSAESLLRLAFRAFVWAVARHAEDAMGKPRPRPKRTQLSVLGETLALQHHGQLLRAAVAALRWNMTELKMHHLGIQQGAASDALKQHVRRTLSILQRQERRSSSEYVSSALHAWHQVVTTSRRRTKVFDILRRPAQKFGLLRSFSAWKARVLASRRARSLSTLQDRRMALGFLLRWSHAVRSLRQQKERQRFALGEGHQRDRMMLHRMVLHWRAVVAEVKKNCAFLQRSVVLAIGAYDPCDRRQVAVCWAFWRLYMRQNLKALALRLQRCRVRLQQYCTAWATSAREAGQQRREIRHMERKQELWAAKARRRGLHLSFWRWQLHLQSSKLLLKADSAVALKASLGLLIVLRFCWTSWALLSGHRCSLAEQGQQGKIQGARHLVSTLRRIIASHLTRLRETVLKRRRADLRCGEAHWWDFYCTWTSRRIQQDKLRAFCHAWHALVLKLTRKSHRSNSAMEALAFSAADHMGRWLRLLLRAWRAAKGRGSRRRRSQVVPRCGAKGMLASLFQLWRLHVQQLHEARVTQQRCSQACAQWLKWHEGQLRKLLLLLCFCALRFDALSARARKAHTRLAQVWSEQLRQERLMEATRQQRAARRFEKDLSRLKARSFSDGKLQAMGCELDLPEPVARPRPEPTAMPAMAIAIEPVVRQPASPPTKLAPKACAARSVVVLDRADRRLVDLLERRGAIEEALSLHTSRLVKD